VIWGNFSRRGTHVNIPEIGSRAGEIVFGGISEIYADLRRESFGRNLKLSFFGVLVVVPRGAVEEGGQLVCILCILGLYCSVVWDGVGLSPNGRGCLAKNSHWASCLVRDVTVRV
jgi:hypothetical protein